MYKRASHKTSSIMNKIVIKRFKIIFGSLVGLAILMFLALLIHIGIMVKKHTPEERTIQMARADFSQPVDSLEMVHLTNNIKDLAGVRSTFFNPKSKILIYTFDNRKNTAQKIYDEVIKPSGLSSKRFTVSATEMKKGCPVIDQSSFYGKLTALVTKVIQ